MGQLFVLEQSASALTLPSPAQLAPNYGRQERRAAGAPVSRLDVTIGATSLASPRLAAAKSLQVLWAELKRRDETRWLEDPKPQKCDSARPIVWACQWDRMSIDMVKCRGFLKKITTGERVACSQRQCSNCHRKLPLSSGEERTPLIFVRPNKFWCIGTTLGLVAKMIAATIIAVSIGLERGASPEGRVQEVVWRHLRW